MKKIIFLILALLMMLSVSGCASILDGETVEIKPYEAKNDDKTATEDIIELNSAEEFSEALNELVENYEDSAVFNVKGIPDLENTLNEICRRYTTEDPLGAYATYYIRCDVTPIVSYDKVSVSIVYKHTKEEIDSLEYVASELYFQQMLRNNLRDYNAGFTFYTSMTMIDLDYIQRVSEELFRKNPGTIATMPKIEVSYYPSNNDRHIVEIDFTYDYTKSILQTMTSSMEFSANSIIAKIENEGETPQTDIEYLDKLCNHFYSSTICLIEGYSGIYSTAYELLGNGIGSNESYAMAMKVLCDRLRINCTVVKGTKDGEAHFWNIVTVDGNNYHIDMSTIQKGETAAQKLLSDSVMKEHYMWDAAGYSTCEQSYPIETAEENLQPEDEIPAEEENNESVGESDER